MSIYSYCEGRSILKTFCKILLLILFLLCLSNLATGSARANYFTLKLFNQVGEPIHLRSAKVTGAWIDDPAKGIIFPPSTIKSKAFVILRASDKGWLSPNPSGSLVYEAANYGRTLGRVEIVFTYPPTLVGVPHAACVPAQKCRVDRVRLDQNNQPIVEIYIV